MFYLDVKIVTIRKNNGKNREKKVLQWQQGKKRDKLPDKQQKNNSQSSSFLYRLYTKTGRNKNKNKLFSWDKTPLFLSSG